MQHVVHFVLADEMEQALEEGRLRYHRLDVEEVELDEEEEALNELDFSHANGGAAPPRQVDVVDSLYKKLAEELA